MGSSPRVRGKPRRTSLIQALYGLIPACAGKTPGLASPQPPSRAHPRVCGENPRLLSPKHSDLGSSPRVRGKRQQGRNRRPAPRLIPACAGKTAGWNFHQFAGSAHPRVCGENTKAASALTWSDGSSPRVRGKLIAVRVFEGSSGLIPACAGKTTNRTIATKNNRAHPRVCGENFFRLFPRVRGFGSSPRVRGKQACVWVGMIRSRLIPACAGKTSTTECGKSWIGAHPRVCGENTTHLMLMMALPGSSPRVRGKLNPDRAPGRRLGLIPACAGKTIPAYEAISEDRAHPRVCGENWDSARMKWPRLGSSPRVRGKLSLFRHPGDSARLIPACAGKTPSTGPSRSWAAAHPRVCGENTERSGVLTLRSVRSWKTLSFPPSLKVTHCWTFMQLSLSRIRL